MCLDETFRDVLLMNPDGKNYPDVSVHYADVPKNSDESEPSQNPNGDKSDILFDLLPDEA